MFSSVDAVGTPLICLFVWLTRTSLYFTVSSKVTGAPRVSFRMRATARGGSVSSLFSARTVTFGAVVVVVIFSPSLVTSHEIEGVKPAATSLSFAT